MGFPSACAAWNIVVESPVGNPVVEKASKLIPEAAVACMSVIIAEAVEYLDPLSSTSIRQEGFADLTVA